MGFQEQYRLLEVIADKEARVFRAVQTATGRSVLVHQFFSERTPAGSATLARLLFLHSQSPSQKSTSLILDMGDFDGNIYVVTEDAEPFMDLRSWLSAQIAEPSQTSGGSETNRYSASPLGADSTSLPPVGDSTARFSSPREVFGKPGRAEPPLQSPGETPTIQSAPAPESSTGTEAENFFRQGEGTPTLRGRRTASTEMRADLSPPPAQSKREPGEFTRMFSGMGAPKLGEPPPASPKSTPTSLDQQETPPLPGMPFAAQSPPLTAPAGPADTKSAMGSLEGPGEFTRMFSGAAKPAAPIAPESVQKTEPSAEPLDKPAPSGIPEGFEVVFRSRKQQPKTGAGPTAAAKQPPSTFPTPQTSKEGPGTFTRFFHAPGTPASPVEPPSGSRETPQATSPPPTGEGQRAPGEFTRMFSAVPDETVELPVDRKRQVPPSPAPSSPSRTPSEGPGEFTGMFGSPQAGKPTGSATPIQPPRQSTYPADRGKDVPLSPAQPPPSRAPSEGPGEFTGMFGSPQAGKPAGSAAPIEPVRRPTSPFGAPPAPKEEPGEFTRMFQAPSASQDRPETLPPSTASTLRSNSPAAQQGPGEFTAIIQGYKAPRPTTPNEPSPILPTPARPESGEVRKQPGEYTMLFQSPVRPVVAAPASTSPLPPQPPEAPVEPAAPSGPGEYTRVISGQSLQQSIGRPSVPPSAAAMPSVPAPVQPMPVPAMPPMQMPQPPAISPQQYVQPSQFQASPGGVSMQAPQVSPGMPVAPGQFQPSMQPFNVPAGAPQWAPPPPQPSKKVSLLPLIIILGSIFVVTVGLILFFALRH